MRSSAGANDCGAWRPSRLQRRQQYSGCLSSSPPWRQAGFQRLATDLHRSVGRSIGGPEEDEEEEEEEEGRLRVDMARVRLEFS